MLNGLRICVVMPGYNAEHTVRKTFEEIPRELVDDVLLVDDGSTDRTVHIAQALGVPNSSLSFHLAQLSRAGLIAQRRAGRSLIYSADFAAMNRLVAFLTENCCGGADCAPCGPGEGCVDDADCVGGDCSGTT